METIEIKKTYRIEILTQDTILEVQEADGTIHPQQYRRVHYIRNDLDRAKQWAKTYIKKTAQLRPVR